MKAKKEAQRLSRVLGIKCNQSGMAIYVWPPVAIYSNSKPAGERRELLLTTVGQSELNGRLREVLVEKLNTFSGDDYRGVSVCLDWFEVLGLLERYKADLAFHALGISGEDTDLIISAIGVTVKELLDDWVVPFPDLQENELISIVADWLEDHSDIKLAKIIREALTNKICNQ